MSRKRRPAVAGRFYPADAEELRAGIDACLAEGRARACAAPARPSPLPAALIGPHAGILYSGPIAGSVYARLESLRQRVARVLLLGPSHRVPLRGLAASTAEAFVTPLGEIPLDTAAVARLVETTSQVRFGDEAHEHEHSLELHLPFLQATLDSFRLIPLVVGEATAAEVAAVIAAVRSEGEVFVAVSSDLSHYLPYEVARRVDNETTEKIVGLDYEGIDARSACGARPVAGLLRAAHEAGWSVEVVDVRSSGDTAGPRSEVVGYGGYLFA